MEKNNNNLPKWIWQQTNEITLGKTNNCKNTHLVKYTFVKTQTHKGSKKTINKWWKLKPSKLFLLWKKKKTINIQCYIYMEQKT
jgi:hypothetical protein